MPPSASSPPPPPFHALPRSTTHPPVLTRSPSARSLSARSPLTRALSRLRAPLEASELRALERHWGEVEAGEGTSAGYSEQERLHALRHAIPPLASAWVAVNAPRRGADEEEKDPAAERARHTALASLLLLRKKATYLRLRLGLPPRAWLPLPHEVDEREWGVPMDRERYVNGGPGWERE
ncbi:hypothetical protein JCM10450v2_007661 [Rhodotorula kratochvilovae]